MVIPFGSTLTRAKLSVEKTADAFTTVYEFWELDLSESSKANSPESMCGYGQKNDEETIELILKAGSRGVINSALKEQ
jgi:hypothetical protein